jgi:hypothetical protein
VHVTVKEQTRIRAYYISNITLTTKLILCVSLLYSQVTSPTPSTALKTLTMCTMVNFRVAAGTNPTYGRFNSHFRTRGTRSLSPEHVLCRPGTSSLFRRHFQYLCQCLFQYLFQYLFSVLILQYSFSTRGTRVLCSAEAKNTFRAAENCAQSSQSTE